MLAISALMFSGLGFFWSAFDDHHFMRADTCSEEQLNQPAVVVVGIAHLKDERLGAINFKCNYS